MFTGLIERTGRVIGLINRHNTQSGSSEGSTISELVIDPGASKYSTALGDSISVNGCCLTVTSTELNMLRFDVSSETIARTSLSFLLEDSLVNLERAMALGDRLGGHMVSGHVDTLGEIGSIDKKSDGWFVTVNIPIKFRRYVIDKGSICIDGISLTINKVHDTDTSCTIDLMIIPKTVESTSFSDMLAGQQVNLEVDLIGKYVERLTQPF